MNSEQDDKDGELLKDVLAGRTFTLADFIAKEGGDFLKGESPVPKLLQVKTELNLLIKENVSDSLGALKATLQDLVEENELQIAKNLDKPLMALVEMLESLINNTNLFYEFVKRVDIKWGQIYGKRPHFQSPGQPPHPDDDYTHESVRQKLDDFLTILKAQQ
ncbi:hypothetical protein C7H19_02840 [Aphanothece hegewaldii CCALA 016]|uniref:Uncharacterized protein n=1 Tax=Aphanothece hegewaldii CCALA 016 TaxID=2107694 RepID=A0A2T1M2M6_9CHRO|nr:hypothetical protein [Aphanothece hegewaldii]PSF39006.1 hypothetical protein C7H19_02840 [Aphanothece hegewaldii CCALA 016]